MINLFCYSAPPTGAKVKPVRKIVGADILGKVVRPADKLLPKFEPIPAAVAPDPNVKKSSTIVPTTNITASTLISL